jgi:tetratricopeptide (TPR) repeat protein
VFLQVKYIVATVYLQDALKAKGFIENYRKNKAKDIPIDKTVFIMYAIEMMINISRAYNMGGDFNAAFENEQDIKYIYRLLHKRGIRFYSQEFQVNTVFAETLLRQGKIKEAYKVLTTALGSESISSSMDLFCAYVSRAEANVLLRKYDEAIEDCKKALEITNHYSHYFLITKCKCIYHMIFAYYKQRRFTECMESFADFWKTAKKLSVELTKTGSFPNDLLIRLILHKNIPG